MNPLGQQPPEEEDSDYDIFSAYRPEGITVDDNVADELDGEELDAASEYRPKVEEIEGTKAKKKAKADKKFTQEELEKDYAKQFAKETLIGVGGTWGDLAELAGIRPEQTKAEEEKNYRDFDTLDRIKTPGYKPSWEEIVSLEGNDAPPSFGLPTSGMLRDANDFVGGPGEPETPAGKYGERSGKLYGAGLAFGQVNPLPAVAAGTAGQAVEDLGGGPLAQAATEIATLLLTQGRGAGKTLVGSAKEEVKKKINELRKLGYTEEEITLAINSASKGKKGGFKASKGSKTEQAFENFAEHSDQMVLDILESEIPGFKKGVKEVHELASDAYAKVAQDASQIVIKDSTPFINAATRVVKEVRRNLGKNPEAEAFLNRLHDAVVASTKSPTAENFMNFYKELNKAGNWMNRSQKERLITQVKEGIKDTFKSEGKAGRKLANDFEMANKGIQKAYRAEELMGIVQKSTTQEGINFKQLHKAFDDPKNVQLFEDVLGTSQTRNLELIAKTGKEVKDFDKAWKAVSLVTGTPTSIASNIGYMIYSGNWVGLAAIKGGEAVGRKLAEKSLTDPRFQNLLIRGLHAIKNESPKAFKSVDEAMKKYLEEEGINLPKKG